MNGLDEIHVKIKNLTNLRLNLLKNGWKPLPLVGKAPRLSDWINVAKNITNEQIIQITQTHPEWGNTGILCDGVVGVDIDVLDELVVAEIVSIADELLGISPLYRIGKAPKALIVYRAAQMQKRMTPEVIMPSGERARVEILANGQQFAAFGIHPETGGPWVWNMDSPETITPEEAPFVTYEQCTEFLSAAEEILREHGGRTRETLPMQFNGPAVLKPSEPLLQPKSINQTHHDIDQENTSLLDTPIEKILNFNKIRTALTQYKNADLPYDSWLAIGFAIFESLGEEGSELWASWSATSSKNNPVLTAKTWQSITKRKRPEGAPKITERTLFYEALKAEGLYVGEQIKDDLIARNLLSSDESPAINAHKAPTSEKNEWETLGSLLRNPPAEPEDIVSDIIAPGTINLIAGAPKTGKTWFAMDFAIHCAGGKGFLDNMFYPIRPLKIVYLQAELPFPYFAKRLRKLTLPEEYYEAACKNFVCPRQFKDPLTKENITLAIEKSLEQLNGCPPDIVFIDPLRNFFNDPTGKGENDATAMIRFMRECVEPFIHVFPNCSVIIIHHTRKASKKDFADNPFDSIAGSSAIRGYYSTGMILHVPDETVQETKLFIEARHSEKHYPPQTLIRNETGRMVVTATSCVRLEGDARNKRHVAEIQRQNEVIITLIRKEAVAGTLYTKSQFASKFQNQAGLGSHSSIERRLINMAACHLIKFRKDNLEEIGVAPHPRSKHQFMVVERMEARLPNGALEFVSPDHECDKGTGNIVPIGSCHFWGDPTESAESDTLFWD